MYDRELEVLFLSKADEYIQSLSTENKAKIKVHIDECACGNFEAIQTKQLRGAVREIIVGKYRVIYFIEKSLLFVCDVFAKSSQKTPKRRIDNATKIHKEIIKQLEK